MNQPETSASDSTATPFTPPGPLTPSTPLTPPAPLGARTWWTIVVVGLVGQIAWTIENMYLNLFVYERISPDPAVIAAMVGVSAVAATIATLLVGAWSDRVGRRRLFVAIGYMIWGALTAAFGLFGNHGEDAATFAGATAAGTATIVTAGIIALDAVLTLFGSGANDAAFNAWVTDSTVPANRGRVDGVLSVFPLVSMLLVFGILDPLTRAGNWQLFFLIVGAITSLAGVAAWFLMEDRAIPRRTMPAVRAVLGEFRLAAIRANPVLYVTLAIMAAVGIATQVFMPYLIIYVQNYLRIDYALVLGIVVVAGAILTVLGGRVMDRVGKDAFLLPVVAVFAAGLIGFWPARELVPVILVGILAMSGMLSANAAVAAMVRDATPLDRAGAIQGLRIIAMVLIPMVIGPSIGAAVISGAGQTYVDLGVVKPVPGPEIFPVAAAILVLTVPALWMLRRHALRRHALQGRPPAATAPGAPRVRRR
ncbi:MAG TPA: MFS transporter [Actinomycetaceae bacterium]|nr:MFS transporter [Actinomycetaceae bacterium]